MSDEYIKALKDVNKLVEKMRRASIPINHFSMQSLLSVLIREKGSARRLLWSSERGFYVNEREGV